MKIRPSDTYFIYNNNEYTLGKYSHGKIPDMMYHFISLDESKYPSEILMMREMKVAYRTAVIIKTKDCEVFFEEMIEENVRVRMGPGGPCIEKLKAYKVDGGGWYEAIIPKKEIDYIWEERYVADGFLFPEGVNFAASIEI